jgi:hypothetical protein
MLLVVVVHHCEGRGSVTREEVAKGRIGCEFLMTADWLANLVAKGYFLGVEGSLWNLGGCGL